MKSYLQRYTRWKENGLIIESDYGIEHAFGLARSCIRPTHSTWHICTDTYAHKPKHTHSHVDTHAST